MYNPILATVAFKSSAAISKSLWFLHVPPLQDEYPSK